MDAASTTRIVLKELAGHAPTKLDPLQQFLAPHVNSLTAFWFSVWCMTGIILLAKLWYEYREQKDKHGK